MFNVGDLVVYGSNGVCRVQEIGALKSPGVPKDRPYYTLCPCYRKGSTIFTPVDNTKVPMRPVLAREEAVSLLRGIDAVESLPVTEEKRREALYKEALLTCDCRELVRVLKTICQRVEKRLASGKKTTNQDERYLQLAKEALCGELAAVLEVPREKIWEYVIGQIKGAQEREKKREAVG